MTVMQLSACATVKAVFEPVENTVDGFSALNKCLKTTVFAKVSASFRRKLGSRTQVLRHKYLETAVISTGSMTVMQLSACATVKAVFEPVENTVDVFSAFNKDPKTAVFAKVSASFRRKLGKQGFALRHKCLETAVDALPAFNTHLETVVDGLPALNKCPKTAVYGLPAFNKYPKTAVDALPALDKYAKTAVDTLPAFNKCLETAVDGLPALNKHPKTAVDGLSSLEERTKTAVDGILSHRGRVTTAVAALSYGFSARFALGYSITQKIKRGIFV